MEVFTGIKGMKRIVRMAWQKLLPGRTSAVGLGHSLASELAE
jgi:hypothetical protein